jgi:hypothetical protein
MKEVFITRTKNGVYHKVVKKTRDGMPVLTPLFEITDDGRGQQQAIEWAKDHGYQVT